MELNSQDKAIDTLDFIIKILSEHEKDLDLLINQLVTITERLEETGNISGRIEKIQDRLASLQDDMINIKNCITSPQELPSYTQEPSVTVKCRQWEDFKILAAGAEKVSYLFQETKKSFQAFGLKKDRILSYTGKFPQDTLLLKLWLSRELNIAEQDVFEGTIDMG